MKKITFLLLLTIAFISCTGDDKLKIDSSEIVGAWNWTSTDGGVAFHIHETPESTGKDYQLILNSNNSYSLLENGITVSKGTFELSMRESQLFNKVSEFITFSGNMIEVHGLVLNGMITRTDQNTLNIMDDFPDGIGSTFSKIE